MAEEPTPQQVQDDVREKQLALLLKLNLNPSRTGSDARDEAGNPYELKTVTTGSVTTGRDVGMPYLARLRLSYLVVAKGVNSVYGFKPDDVYFLSPEMLEPWISKLEAQLADKWQVVTRAVELVRQHGFADEDADTLLAIGARGVTKNNPKISWSYVTKNGVRIEEPASVHLRELVAQHPLPTGGTDGEIAAERLAELEDEGGLEV